MPTAYTPTEFSKPGFPNEKAYSWAAHYQLLWDGYLPIGEAPSRPRSQITAHLSDIDTTLATILNSRPVHLLGDTFRPEKPSLAPSSKVTAEVTTSAFNAGGSTATLFPWYLCGGLIGYNGTPRLDPTNGGATAYLNDPDTELRKVFDMEFYLTGDWFGFFTLGAAAQDWRVWVDDQEVGTGFAMPTGNQILNLTFAQWGTYKIRIAGPLSIYYFGWKAAVDTLSMSTPRRTMAVISDSYYEGVGFSYADTQAVHLRSLTGWKVLNWAEGGTGFINNRGGIMGAQPYGGPSRLALLEAHPEIDHLIVNGSGNDIQYSWPAVQAAMAQFYEDVKAIRPDLAITQILNEDVNYFNTWNNAGLNAAMREVAEDADNVVKIISPVEDNWLSGTGYVGATVGDGNQDKLIGPDGVHLSALGCRHHAQLTVEKMKTAHLRVGEGGA